MKNTFGTSVAVTVFGESHGEAIGAVIDGIAPGIAVDEEFVIFTEEEPIDKAFNFHKHACESSYECFLILNA